jgi:hypothetical protein
MMPALFGAPQRLAAPARTSSPTPSHLRHAGTNQAERSGSDLSRDAGFHINAAQVHIRWIFRQDYWDPVLAGPALLLAMLAIYRHRTRHRLAALPAAIAVTAIAVIGWRRVARHVPNGGWLRLPASAIIKSEVYVIIGLGVLVTAATAELISYSRARSNNRASQTPQLSPSNEPLQTLPLPTASPPTSSLPYPEV